MGLLKIFLVLLKNERQNFSWKQAILLDFKCQLCIFYHLCASQEIFQICKIYWLVQRAFRRNTNDQISTGIYSVSEICGFILPCFLIS